MLSLTTIYLHNWHRFQHTILLVRDSLYLTGHNGSGKSSILDALQLVLIANRGRIRFNASVQDRSDRTLEGYVMGRTGESGVLRPGNTVAYVALEFTDTDAGGQVTVGVCVEVGPGRETERLYFILGESLEPDLFMHGEQPLARAQLRAVLRGRKRARDYEHINEYQDDLLNRLGGLNPRFFDLFLRALRFQPIYRVSEFVETWLLPEAPLDTDSLQHVVQRLDDLRAQSREVDAKLEALEAIVGSQNEVQRWRDQHAEYSVLAALLRARVADITLQEVEARRRQAEQNREMIKAALAALQGTLVQTQTDLLEAQVALRQSDVLRRKGDLENERATHQTEAERITQAWLSVRRDVQRHLGVLEPLGAASQLTEDERSTCVELAMRATDLSPQAPPPEDLAEMLARTEPLLTVAGERVQKTWIAAQTRLETLRHERERLHNEIAALRAGGGVIYPESARRGQALLAPVCGAPPPLLCELLEIPDESWQDAIEGILGDYRFALIVPPEHFALALEVLHRARDEQGLHGVGLLDLAAPTTRAAGEVAHRVDSLASHVVSREPRLTAFLDAFLGPIRLSASVAELRAVSSSVTDDVMLYGDAIARGIDPRMYRPRFIGEERARRSQLEIRDVALQEVCREIAELEPQEKVARDTAKVLQTVYGFAALEERLAHPLDPRSILERVRVCTELLSDLDLSGIAALQAEVSRLTTLSTHQRQEEHGLVQRLLGAEAEVARHAADRAHAQKALDGEQEGAQAACVHYQGAVAGAQGMVAERLQRPDLHQEIQNATNTAANYRSRAENELEDFKRRALQYNVRYQFSADAYNPEDERYSDERDRLQATELPRYKEAIALERERADEELRQHVLHKLRESIRLAKAEIDKLNDALSRLDFRGERYRFIASPPDDTVMREFYDVVMGSESLGLSPLFESDFYARFRDAFDRFYERLITTPLSTQERAEQQRLKDYRTYLTYDIEVIAASGQRSRLSKIMGATSGGETQTPFYVAIAASFVQLYRAHSKTSRPTIRLVVFDEAFDKMDQQRIGATLDLLHYFGLQVITATPLEKCEYLAPKMRTSVVLTSTDDHVVIDPYENYAARLENLYEAEAV